MNKTDLEGLAVGLCVVGCTTLFAVVMIGLTDLFGFLLTCTILAVACIIAAYFVWKKTKKTP